MNTAARMESLREELAVDVVPSGDVARALDSTQVLRPLGDATVKGKAQPIAVFTLT